MRRVRHICRACGEVLPYCDLLDLRRHLADRHPGLGGMRKYRALPRRIAGVGGGVGLDRARKKSSQYGNRRKPKC